MTPAVCCAENFSLKHNVINKIDETQPTQALNKHGNNQYLSSSQAAQREAHLLIFLLHFFQRAA